MVLLWNRIKHFGILFFSSHKRSTLRRYTVPLVVITVIVVFNYWLRIFISENTFHLLPLLIIVSAGYGGFGPGILATACVAVLDTFLFIPSNENFLSSYNTISTIILIVEGIIISLISEAKRQADAKKDEFIGFASHELKNPLATIQGYAQLLQKYTVASEKVTGIGKSIEEQTKRAALLINELLDITKIETGKLAYHKETVVLREL